MALKTGFTVQLTSLAVSLAIYSVYYIPGVLSIAGSVIVITTTDLGPGEHFAWAFPVGVMGGALMIIGGLVVAIPSGRAGCSVNDVLAWEDPKA